MYTCSRHPDAIACIKGGPEAPNLLGEVRFYQKRNHVLVVAQISGLPSEHSSGFFAMHIHEGLSCAGKQFEQTGSHFNPTGMSHPSHAGDLPPLLSCHGTAYLAVQTDRFSVPDVLGHTVVIHSGPDDFHSQPAGNSGFKLACGVIHPN